MIVSVVLRFFVLNEEVIRKLTAWLKNKQEMHTSSFNEQYHNNRGAIEISVQLQPRVPTQVDAGSKTIHFDKSTW